MNTTLSFQMAGGRFQYKVTGIILHNNKVLLTTVEGLDFWHVPGGRVEHLESSMTALQREIQEELNSPCKIERLLWIFENMFYLPAWQCNVHELVFYYLISLPDIAAIYNMDSIFGMDQWDGKPVKLEFKWFALTELQTINLAPKFLQQGLLDLPTLPQHIIINEL